MEVVVAVEYPFVWHELITADQKSSADFCCGLFGWVRREVDAGPFGAYTLFQVEVKDVAGIDEPNIRLAREWFVLAFKLGG